MVTRPPEPALRRTLLRWLLAPLMALLLLDGVVAYWSSLRAADGPMWHLPDPSGG